jgi:hypothetical protein
MLRVRHDVYVHFAAGDELKKLLEAFMTETREMGELTNKAVAQLVEEANESQGKLATLTAAVLNFPNVTAAAVADALAAANVDDATAAAAIDAARSEISDAVDAAMAAQNVNLPEGEEPAPTPEPAPEPEPEA